MIKKDVQHSTISKHNVTVTMIIRKNVKWWKEKKKNKFSWLEKWKDNQGEVFCILLLLHDFFQVTFSINTHRFASKVSFPNVNNYFCSRRHESSFESCEISMECANEYIASLPNEYISQMPFCCIKMGIKMT